ncbi:MAG: cytochrome c oxidase assembly protein [Actinobacteria bacterium]|nr:MAG: cytochrome c oxidase assembly protein [Actinomycetota bacterium]RIK07836.1 MAG: hypothetical protein DCC48_02470 [Acidobacteriota bacterium]
MSMLAAYEFWRFQPHVEIWVLVAGLVALGFYVTRVIQPKAVAVGEPPVSRAQKAWFALGVATLWIATDWPMHDIAEEYLYAVHMVQHLLLTFIIAPMFLMACPTWLARLILGEGRVRRVIYWLARPIVAAIIFNAVAAFTHWAPVVNLSADNGFFHYGVHTTMVFSALLMWMPVVGPVPELRISLPAQMVYLFFMSVIPTVPAAWLTFAEGTLYNAYDVPQRLWGVSVAEDQQAAGLIMKIGGGLYLWAIITALFFRWSSGQDRRRYRGKLVTAAGSVVDTEDDLLTYDEVAREFDRLGPAPEEDRSPN